jgi:hypothetical protein
VTCQVFVRLSLASRNCSRNFHQMKTSKNLAFNRNLISLLLAGDHIWGLQGTSQSHIQFFNRSSARPKEKMSSHDEGMFFDPATILSLPTFKIIPPLSFDFLPTASLHLSSARGGWYSASSVSFHKASRQDSRSGPIRTGS